MRHPRSLLFAVPLAGLALAACGGSSTSSGSTAASAPANPAPVSTTSASSHSSAAAGRAALSIAANPGGALQFSTTRLTAHAGAVKISFTNQAPEGHNLTIATPTGQVVGSTPTFQGGVRVVTAHLKPGTYTFFCSVPGHRTAGMQGTLVVS